MTKTPAPKNSNNKRMVNRKAVTPMAKPVKRENTFSKSKDIREDRGSRQMKNSTSSQTLPHAR